MQAWSASALWNPNDNFQAHLIYDDIDDETNARPTTCFNGAGELFNFVGQPAEECNPAMSDFHYNTFHSSEQRASVEVEAVTLNMQWNINDNNKLVAIYGTREMEETSLQEFDNSAADLFRVSRPQTEEQERVRPPWAPTYGIASTPRGKRPGSSADSTTPPEHNMKPRIPRFLVRSILISLIV